MRNALPLLLAALDEAFDRRSWHGTNLKGSLRGLDAAAAAWRPAPGRHNIHELALHAAYWKYVVRRRLTREKRSSFPIEGGNFFTRDGASAREWNADIALLVSEHRKLRETIARFKPKDLDARRVWLIRGAAAHDLYHAGQIQLLKRLRTP